MNLSENLSNSFDFAKKLLSDGGRLIILIVLDIIPIVNWIVIGYAARVLRESPSTETPPKLEKYGDMFVDGAKVTFASLIYMLVPTILIAAGASSLFAGMLSLQGGVVTPSVMLGGTGVVLLLVGIVLGIILLFLLAVGMAHMLKTGKFGKAFAFGEILKYHPLDRLGEVRRLDSSPNHNQHNRRRCGWFDTICWLGDLRNNLAHPKRLHIQIAWPTV